MSVAKKFAVIQRSTDAVFGIGETRDQAIEEAAKWLCDENGQQGTTVEHVESMLTTDRVSGAIAVIDSDDPEWNDYVTK